MRFVRPYSVSAVRRWEAGQPATAEGLSPNAGTPSGDACDYSARRRRRSANSVPLETSAPPRTTSVNVRVPVNGNAPD